MSSARGADDGLSWQLLYTKPHAEASVQAGLRTQGLGTRPPAEVIREVRGRMDGRDVVRASRLSHRLPPHPTT